MAPRVSIVVEWENARLSDASRSIAMLREVRRQVDELAAEANRQAGPAPPCQFEMILLFDAKEIDGERLHTIVGENLGAPDGALMWRLLPGEEAGYYRLKDQGARASTGEIIVFVDCDVIPEKGWLKYLLSPFEDPAVPIVSGRTHIQPTDLVGKAFALTWFFPLRKEDGGVERVSSFFANNLAMRRSLYSEYPFPCLPGTSRGGCIALAAQLAAAGIPAYENPMARVGHPAPNGAKHFVLRALAQGRDRLSRARSGESRWLASWIGSSARLLRHSGRCAWNISTKFYRVKLNPILIPAAFVVSFTYYFFYWVGEMMSHLRVPLIRRVRV